MCPSRVFFCIWLVGLHEANLTGEISHKALAKQNQLNIKYVENPSFDSFVSSSAFEKGKRYTYNYQTDVYHAIPGGSTKTLGLRARCQAHVDVLKKTELQLTVRDFFLISLCIEKKIKFELKFRFSLIHIGCFHDKSKILFSAFHRT